MTPREIHDQKRAKGVAIRQRDGTWSVFRDTEGHHGYRRQRDAIAKVREKELQAKSK